MSRRVARLSSLMPHTEDFAPFSDALRLVAEGRQTFRFDTFGDEAFWGDALHLHEALAQTSPRDALALGLKIDVDALPRKLAHPIAAREGFAEVRRSPDRITAKLPALHLYQLALPCCWPPSLP